MIERWRRASESFQMAAVIAAAILLVGLIEGGGLDWLLNPMGRAFEFIFVEAPIWILKHIT